MVKKSAQTITRPKKIPSSLPVLNVISVSGSSCCDPPIFAPATHLYSNIPNPESAKVRDLYRRENFPGGTHLQE
jgi:hypothetical protein